MNFLHLALAGSGGLVAGFTIKHFLNQPKTQKEAWDKETWDEFQETLMIAAALFLWGAFEYLCFRDSEYASANHTNTTRLVLTNIVNSLFTFKFTKSQVRKQENGT